MSLIPARAWTRVTPFSVTLARSFCSYSALRFIRQAASCRPRHSVVARSPKDYQPLISHSRIRVKTQSRSYWGRRGVFGGLWGRRTRSFWHKPGCKWVISEGDPRSSPRDPECPACQEERNLPYELSAREILWQRQQQMMEEWIKKDPYDALFGRSNDMLKGILRRPLWSPWITHDISAMVQKAFQDTKQDLKSAVIPKPEPTKQVETKPKENERDTSDSAHINGLNFPSLVSEQAKGNVESAPTRADPSVPATGHGYWKVTGVENGTRYEASGELEYDPISGRMMPKAVQHAQKVVPQPSGSQTRIQTTLERRELKDAAQPLDTSVTKVETPGESHTALANVRPPRSSPPSLKSSTEDSRINGTTLSLTKSDDSKAVAAEAPFISSTPSASATIPTPQPAPPGLSDGDSYTHKGAKVKEWQVAKKALENSWAQEYQRQQKQNHRRQASIREDPIGTKHSERSAVYDYLTRKCQPIKHMTTAQLTEHKKKLLTAWTAKRTKSAIDESSAKSAADNLLDQEVAAQKFAMARLENKWRSSTKETTNTSNDPQEEPPTPSSATSESKSAFVGAEGDICVNAPKYASPSRLYKKKAPHALMEKENQAQDRSLVRAVREIYEKAYGPITTQHRQGICQLLKQDCEAEPDIPASNVTKANTGSKTSHVELQPTTESLASKTRPARQQQLIKDTSEAQALKSMSGTPKSDSNHYLVLAHDPDTGAMYTATASSSFQPPTAEENLSASDALVRLSNPAKFLSHLAQHQAAGYEIVSANKNLLVFKKLGALTDIVDEAASSEPISAYIDDKKASRINPIDGTSQSKTQTGFIRTTTGNYASPTGFVNHELPQTQHRSSTQQPNSVPGPGNPRVNRTEAVFSGQPPHASNGNGHGGNRPGGGRFGGRRFKRGPASRVIRRTAVAVRKMLFVGFCMGVLLYGLGAFIETKSRHAKSTEPLLEQPGTPKISDWEAIEPQKNSKKLPNEQTLEDERRRARRERLEKMRERRGTEREERKAERRRRRREHQQTAGGTQTSAKERREIPATTLEPRVLGLTADEMAATSLLLASFCAIPLLWIWTGNR